MANLEAYGEKVIGTTGSVVEWTQTQASGTKIAEIDIDGTTTDVYAPSGGGGSVNYSTTEQVVGTWIDGKPVYQKVIEFPLAISVGTSWVNTGQTVSDAKAVISSCGFYQDSNAVPWLATKIENGVVSITTPRAFSCSKIIIQYTKTTD